YGRAGPADPAAAARYPQARSAGVRECDRPPRGPRRPDPATRPGQEWATVGWLATCGKRIDKVLAMRRGGCRGGRNVAPYRLAGCRLADPRLTLNQQRATTGAGHLR